MIKLDFEKTGGIIPVITQDYENGEVLMLAYMNQESWELTCQTGIAHYWSRSRKTLWKKGESSGHIQKVKKIFVDCDDDTLLIKVEQHGAACHTGYRSCFYRQIINREYIIEEKPIIDPDSVYK